MRLNSESGVYFYRKVLSYNPVTGREDTQNLTHYEIIFWSLFRYKKLLLAWLLGRYQLIIIFYNNIYPDLRAGDLNLYSDRIFTCYIFYNNSILVNKNNV